MNYSILSETQFYFLYDSIKKVQSLMLARPTIALKTVALRPAAWDGAIASHDTSATFTRRQIAASVKRAGFVAIRRIIR